MRSERGTAEQTAPARDREESGGGEREAGMTNYSSRRSVGDRLPRWVCLTPEPGKMGRNTGKIAAVGQMAPPLLQIVILFMLEVFKKKKKKSQDLQPPRCAGSVSRTGYKRYYSGTSVISEARWCDADAAQPM